MASESAYIFIDEYGAPDIEVPKKGNEPYFIYAAVVIKEKDVQQARQLLTELHSKYFSAGFIKSNKIHNDSKGYATTISVLTDLKSLPHYVVALVVDKSKIDSQSGLAYEKSFIKYFNRMLSVQFLSVYEEMHIYLDKSGWGEFQNSLKGYMRDKVGFSPNLFTNNTFDIADDITEEPLIQLADFYAGTIGKYYCGKYDQNRAEVIHNNFLRGKIAIEWYPEEYVSYSCIRIF